MRKHIRRYRSALRVVDAPVLRAERVTSAPHAPAGLEGPDDESRRSDTCRAPAVAMQFGVMGTVNACCQNGESNYGDVRRQTVRSIWDGAPRHRMAEALQAGVYPVGCEGCAVEHAVGNRRSTPAQAFDRFPDGPHDWPKQMEFTLSNRCNLQCIQCNGLNSSAIRAQREHLPPLPSPYDDVFFRQLEPFLEHLEVAAFLGGEPFLAPQARRVWDMLIARDLHPEVEVTTNATIWNRRVEHYANALKMNFAISIDGATAETYETIRIGATFDQVIENRDRLLATTRQNGSRGQLNYCMMRANWFEVGAFLLEADALDVDALVIVVHEPVEHSLLRLPRAELAAVVDGLEAEDRHMGHRLGRNAPVWRHTVTSLRSHLDRMGSERDSDRLRASAMAEQQVRWPGLLHDDLTQVASDLRVWSEREPIEVSIDGEGLVTSVTTPSWSQHLDTASWIGRHHHEVRDAAVVEVAATQPTSRGGATPPPFGATDTEVVIGSRLMRWRAVPILDAGRLLVGVSPLATLDDPRTVGAIGRLVTWAQRLPVMAHLDPEGCIATIDGQAWASGLGLDLEGCIGQDMQALWEHIETHVGPVRQVRVDDCDQASGLLHEERIASGGGPDVLVRVVHVRGEPLAVLVAAPLVDRTSRQVLAAADELTEWSGRQPVAVTVADGVVVAVDAPVWADDLEPDRWIGSEVRSLLDGSLLDPRAHLERVDDLAPGLTMRTAALESTIPATRWRSLHIEGDDLVLAVAARAVGIDDPRVEAMIDALGPPSGRSPIDVSVDDDGVVAAVDVPASAERFHPQRWIGADARQVAAAGVERLSGHDVHTDEPLPGVTTIETTIDDDGVLALWRSVIVHADCRLVIDVGPLQQDDLALPGGAAYDLRVRAAEVELRAWAAAEPIDVRSRWGIVDSVTTPSWATDLHTEEWVGTHLLAIQERLSTHLGPAEVLSVEEITPGLVAAESLVGPPGSQERFRSLYVQHRDRLLLARRDPGAEVQASA